MNQPAYILEARQMLGHLAGTVSPRELERLEARVVRWEAVAARRAIRPATSLPPLVMRTSGIPTPLDSRYFVLRPSL